MELTALLILFLACVALLARGLRGRRIDDHPLCAACRFDLIGLEPKPARCPECGEDITNDHAIRIGHRQPRRGHVIVGAAGILLFGLAGAGLLTLRARASAIYPTLPTWYLSLEATYLDPPRGREAVEELATRLALGTLDTRRVPALLARALTLQGDRAKPWLVEWGDIIDNATISGLASAADMDRYVRQAIRTSLEAPADALPGGRVTIRYRADADRIGSFFTLPLGSAGVSIMLVDPEGREHAPRIWGATSSNSLNPGRASFQYSATLSAPLRPGRYIGRVECRHSRHNPGALDWIAKFEHELTVAEDPDGATAR